MTFLRHIIIGFVLFPLISTAQSEQFIEWSASKKLSWDDYLARPSLISDAAAITSTALGIEYHVTDNVFTFLVTCRFSKTRSWGRYKTEYILQHEQGHFDITEIYARKLEKELQEYNFNPRRFKSDVDGIYKRIMEEKEEFQNQYDKETDYSRDREQQKLWLRKIDKELSRYTPI